AFGAQPGDAGRPRARRSDSLGGGEVEPGRAGGAALSRGDGASSAAQDRVLILDYGSQFTQLIARRVREERVYSEIHPPGRGMDWIRAWAPKGIILSGGPSSVYDKDAPVFDAALLDLGVPVLGICYGMQLIGYALGADVIPGQREYGRAELTIRESKGLFDG